MLRLLPALLLALLALPALAQDPDLETRLDATIGRQTLGQFWGAVLVARDGEVLLARGYGYANDDLAAITRHSLFDIGSVNKMFTAAAVLSLQDQGRLSTDDTIAKFFLEAGPGAADITIHHLLTHTSGRSDRRGAIQPLDFDDRDEAVRRFCASAAAGPAGDRFEYCNGGYIVLAAIIEQASGRSYEQAVRDLVLQPAGMAHSGFLDGAGLDPAQQTLRVTGPPHAARRGLLLDKGIEPWAWGLRGAGGLVTCLDDLLAFDAAIREGRLLSDAARAQWLIPHKGGYACGWMIERTDEGHLKHHHSGATRGYMAELRRYPEEGVIIAVLSNEISRSLWPPPMIADTLADVLWPPPTLETSVEIDLSREALGEFHSTILEGGLAIRAVPDGAGVQLQASHDDRRRTLLSARLNRAAAERLRSQIRRTLDLDGRPATEGELKFGVYAHAYREQLGDERMLRVADCEWDVMPSYGGVGEGGEEITDPRLVITLTDRAMPGRWFVMLHADDAEAAAIADRLAAALAGDGQ
jgi:CubicO group peptidase (beta-lactamase class C family)